MSQITEASVQINKEFHKSISRYIYPSAALVAFGLPAATLVNDQAIRTVGYFFIAMGLGLTSIFMFEYLALRRNPLFKKAMSDSKTYKSEMRAAVKEALSVERVELKKVAAANVALSLATKARQNHAALIEQNEKKIAELLDEKGQLVRRAPGGIKIYERWIETPEISGSIIGVKASSEDNTSISKRITATRMLAIGVFALAAQKSKAQGEAYCVFDGPEVAGVIVLPANKSIPAGPLAAKIAIQINVLEKKASAWANEKDAQVTALKTENKKLRAEKVAVKEDAEYQRLANEVSSLYRSKVKIPK